MPTDAALLDALLSGNKDALGAETVFLLARTGLAHLFTLSGFHLFAASRVADALTLPVRRFLRHPRAEVALRFAGRLLFLLFLGFALGWSSPFVRAGTFTVLAAGARVFEIRADRAWIFLLSLLAANLLARAGPLSLAYSAFALAGLLWIEPRRPWTRALGPWLFTLPLTALAFGCVPLLAPLWNLSFGLAIGWIVLPLALLSRLLGACGISAEPVAGWNAALLGWLLEALRTAADHAGLAFWVRPLPFATLAFAFLTAYALRRRSRRAIAIAAGAALLVPLWPRPVLAALDVGQGDAIFLAPAGNALLEDVGPPGLHGPAAVTARLETLGVGDLDHVLLSHFDLDHRGGLDDLLARHRVRGALWFREEDLNDPRADRVLAAAERAALPVRFVRAGGAPPGTECWLAPTPTGNDSSPLCRATLPGGARVLLTGDMGEKAEGYFVRTLRPFPTAEILKVAHHGSRTSSTEEFLAATGARTALLSVGARNRYGHPTAETLARLTAAGFRTRRTDQAGTLAFYELGMANHLEDFTEEIMRAGAGSRLAEPGTPAFSRRARATSAWAK